MIKFLIILYLLSVLPSFVDSAVGKKYACLDAPTASNKSFIKCLSFLEKEGEKNWNNTIKLTMLTMQANENTKALIQKTKDRI